MGREQRAMDEDREHELTLVWRLAARIIVIHLALSAVAVGLALYTGLKSAGGSPVHNLTTALGVAMGVTAVYTSFGGSRDAARYPALSRLRARRGIQLISLGTLTAGLGNMLMNSALWFALPAWLLITAHLFLALRRSERTLTAHRRGAAAPQSERLRKERP
jgi:hypothetical protein